MEKSGCRASAPVVPGKGWKETACPISMQLSTSTAFLLFFQALETILTPQRAAPTCSPALLEVGEHWIMAPIPVAATTDRSHVGATAVLYKPKSFLWQPQQHFPQMEEVQSVHAAKTPTTPLFPYPQSWRPVVSDYYLVPPMLKAALKTTPLIEALLLPRILILVK